MSFAGFYSNQNAVENFRVLILRQMLSGILKLSGRDFLILLFVLLFIRLSMTLAAQFLSIFSSRKFYGQLGSAGFYRLLKDVPFSELSSNSIGKYITVAGDQVARVSRLTSTIGLAVIPASLAVVYFSAMYMVNSSAAMGFLAFLLIYIVISFPIFKMLRALGSQSDMISKSINSTFIEALNATATLRSLGVTQVLSRRYATGLENYMAIHRRIEFTQAFAKTAPGLLLLLITIVSLLALPSHNSEDRRYILEWLALSFAAIRIFPALGQVYAALQVVSSDFNACKEVLDFIGGASGFLNYLETSENGSLNSQKTSSDRSSTIKLCVRNVSFSYDKHSRMILDDVCLELEPGKIVGVCGETGVGKSSIAQLLSGLVQPASGEITLFEKSQSGVEVYPLLGNVVMVSQQPFIISDSIKFNITFGRPSTDLEVQKAIEAAHLENVIQSKSHGLHEHLHYQGGNLSGGQKQRLSLARALLKSPMAMILDETTAGLDSRTKNEIMGALKKISSKTIIVIISHDSEILRHCNLVYELGLNGKFRIRESAYA